MSSSLCRYRRPAKRSEPSPRRLLVDSAGCCRVSRGFHTVAGTSPYSISTFRGPVLRSYTAAIDCRQFPAASARCSGDIVTCTSFSASTNVAVETSGPTGGAVPNAGGAPGVAGVCGVWLCRSPFRLTHHHRAKQPHRTLRKKLPPRTSHSPPPHKQHRIEYSTL